MNVLDILKKCKGIKKFEEEIKKDKYSIYISGSTPNHNYLLASDAFTFSNNIIYIAPNTYKATHAYESFCRLLGNDKVSFYCNDELATTELIAVSNDFRFERIKTLKYIHEAKQQLIVTNLQAVLRPIMPLEIFEEHIINLKVGQEINTKELINLLIESGYKKTPTCENVGEFSIRGEIIDIYPIFYDNPIRIDLFDVEIEYIKTYNVINQKSIEKVEEVVIYPVSDFIYSLDESNKVRTLIPNNLIDEKTNEDLLELENYDNPDKSNKFIKYIYNDTSLILDYLDDKICFIEDYNEIKDKYLQLNLEISELGINESMFSFLEDINVLPINEKVIYLEEFKKTLDGIKLTNIIDLKGLRVSNYNQSIRSFLEDIKLSNYQFYILYERENVKNVLDELLKEAEIDYSCNIDSTSKVKLLNSNNGLSFRLDDIVVVSENELFTNIHKKNAIFESSKYNTVTINTKDDIKIGDYVVHYDYGIAQYKGLQTLELSGMINDYIVLQFANNCLYLPVEKIVLIEKYLGSEGSTPKLSKLGTNEWEKKKEKIRSNIENIAKDLIETQAKRIAKKGIEYHTDPELMKSFEEGFGFTETKDQLKAISEISEDMEKGLVIDRLVCGDVGYGKTEIAARAAFKTVCSGYQVAYLAPTTILTRQHYQTFKERFEKFGVNVAMLNRLVPLKEQEQIGRKLKNGEIDIVIGTHRLLNEQFKYKNLGLLIIDEEQRFGVTHKEKIKKMKDNVNVLTLSATPIPRTLQMSLMGIRQFSLINTPPKDRYPIQTYVLEYNKSIVKEAIYKELARNGQVFYLHNNISTLPSTVSMIKKLVPEARICMAHGRLEKEELEDIVQKFIDKEYDVFVCTTIIETGIDIPNSNTLIIDNVERLGLSQLYQIRGRVGRSDKIAYAYLMYQRGKVLTETAAKRLNAIKEFTNLGSGYKIALRDLAIRGSGDILGKEQSGFIDMIGMDLYMKMLNESVIKLTGQEMPKEKQTYNIEVSKHIDDKYVTDEEIKILIHEKINKVDNKEGKQELIEELTDRFGKLNYDILLYIEERYLEVLLNKFHVEKLIEEENFVMFTFPQDISDKVDGCKLITIANKISRNFYFEYKNKKLTVKLTNISKDKKWIFVLTRLLENL